MYPKLALEAHPHANPHRDQFGKRGQFYGIFTRRYRDANGHKKEIRAIGRADASRWKPHQGTQEIARRQRQAAIALVKAGRKAEEHARLVALKLGMGHTYGQFEKMRLNAEPPLAASDRFEFFDPAKTAAITADAQKTLQNMITSDQISIDPKTDGIEFITEQRIGMDLVTSDKPLKTEVLDSGNPVGKRVVWSSSGVEKVGTIKHVVPAGKLPSDFGVKIKDATTPRDHESFIVEAVTTGADVPAKVGSYWPRVSGLKFS